MDGVNELELFEALGLQQEAVADSQAEAEKETDVETGTVTEAEAEKETVEAETKVETETETEPEAADGENSSQSEQQNTEKQLENSKYAAARRKAERERDEAIRRERARHKGELDEMIRAMGLKNPDTGKLLTTKEEYDAYRKAAESKKLEKAIEDGEMDAQEIDKLVDERVKSNPRVLEAERILAESRRQKVRESINAELEEIRKANPEVSDFEALKKLDKYDEISAMIRSGVPLGAAYFYVYRNENRAAALREAERAAHEVNVLKAQSARSRSKGHLGSTASRGMGAPDVPRDTLEMYKQLMPGVSDDDIARHYEKYKK